MVDRDGRLKVTDFGIARTESSQVTRANTVIGSPGYMAPEQYTGAAVDRRVDIFAAGVLLYKLLSGVTPFTGSDEAIMYQIVYGQHGRLSLRGADASLAVFDAIIDSALAKLPAQRFASALDFRDALKAVAGGVVPERLDAKRMLPPRNFASSQTEPTKVVAPPQQPGFVNSVLPSSLPVPTGWDEIDLADLERELTRHVGPVAKVLVRRAARDQVDIREVRKLVASSILDPEVREQFLSATDGSGSRPAFSNSKPAFGNSVLPSRAFTDSQGALPPDGTPLQPDDADKAGTALAVVIGPIGKVLARRCAEGAGTRERFVSRVLEQLTARVDAKQVEALLWRSML
jgi:serine/threonine-protein kinase